MAEPQALSPPVNAGLRYGWAEWAAEWRRWAIRTLKLALLGAYLFCFWNFFSVGGTEGETRVRSAAAGRFDGEPAPSGAANFTHTVGSPEPWLVIEDRPQIPWNSKLRLASTAWFLLAGGLLSYYIYWRIRRAELGGRRPILLYAGPILHTIFWCFVGFVAIASGASAEAHEQFMKLPLGLSGF